MKLRPSRAIRLTAHTHEHDGGKHGHKGIDGQDGLDGRCEGIDGRSEKGLDGPAGWGEGEEEVDAEELRVGDRVKVCRPPHLIRRPN